jgi:hypothetical protein
MIPSIEQMEERKCKGCKSPAFFWDNKAWWCGIDRETAHGACKKNKSKHNIPKRELENLYTRDIK